MSQLVSLLACLLLVLVPSLAPAQAPPKQGGRIVNTIVDRIPGVSQEVTWTWWNKP